MFSAYAAYNSRKLVSALVDSYGEKKFDDLRRQYYSLAAQYPEFMLPDGSKFDFQKLTFRGSSEDFARYEFLLSYTLQFCAEITDNWPRRYQGDIVDRFLDYNSDYLTWRMKEDGHDPQTFIFLFSEKLNVRLRDRFTPFDSATIK